MPSPRSLFAPQFNRTGPLIHEGLQSLYTAGAARQDAMAKNVSILPPNDIVFTMQPGVGVRII
jgi:hypothetical protein